jgi:hypothetical protein
MDTDAKGRDKISRGRERRTRGQENNLRGKVVGRRVMVRVGSRWRWGCRLWTLRFFRICCIMRPAPRPSTAPTALSSTRLTRRPSGAAPAGRGPPHRIHPRDALRVSFGRRPGGRLAPCAAAQRVAVGGPAAAVTRTPGGGIRCADQRGSGRGLAGVRGRGVEPVVSGLPAGEKKSTSDGGGGRADPNHRRGHTGIRGYQRARPASSSRQPLPRSGGPDQTVAGPRPEPPGPS